MNFALFITIIAWALLVVALILLAVSATNLYYICKDPLFSLKTIGKGVSPDALKYATAQLTLKIALIAGIAVVWLCVYYFGGN